MKRFQKLAVVPPLVAPARQHRPEHHQDHVPIFLAHLCQHRPPPQTGPTLASTWLGRVDGFGEDEHEAESDEGSVVPGGFLATESNALEALELSDALLDAGASAVERFRKESGSVLGIRLGGNDGADAAGSGGLAVGL